MAPTLYVASLAALSVFGIYALHGILVLNGAQPMVVELVDSGLVEDGLPWPDWFRSLNDAMVTIPGNLLGFFWPIAIGKLPAISAQGIMFGGQFLTQYTLMLVDGYRVGLQGSVGSYTTLGLVIMQAIGGAVACPAFLALSLAKSTLPTSANVVVTDERYLRAIPLGLTMGLIMPSIWMCLPYPNMLDLDLKVGAIMLWQIFPLLTWLSIEAWRETFSEPERPAPSSTSPSTSPSTQLASLRAVYKFGFAVGAIVHAGALALALTAHFRPDLISPDSGISFWTIFVPSLSTEKVTDVVYGAQGLLKWDFSIAAISQLIWAVAHTSSLRKSGKRLSVFSFNNAFIDSIVRTVLFGPAVAALTFIWERDEAILSGAHEKTK